MWKLYQHAFDVSIVFELLSTLVEVEREVSAGTKGCYEKKNGMLNRFDHQQRHMVAWLVIGYWKFLFGSDGSSTLYSIDP